MKNTLIFLILLNMAFASCRKYQVQYSGFTDPSTPGTTNYSPGCLFIKNGQVWISDLYFQSVSKISGDNLFVTIAAFNTGHDRIAYKSSGGTIYICNTEGSISDSILGKSDIISMDWQEETSILYMLSSSGLISFWGGTIPVSTNNVFTIIPGNCIPAYLQITKDNQIVIQYHSTLAYSNYVDFERNQGVFLSKHLDSYDGYVLKSFKADYYDNFLKGYITSHDGGFWEYCEFSYNLFLNSYFEQTYHVQAAKRFSDNTSFQVSESSPPHLEIFVSNAPSPNVYPLNQNDVISSIELD